MLANQIPAASPEVVGLASAIVDVIVALKSGDTALQAGEAALPDLIAALSNVQNIGSDILLPQNQVYVVWAIAQALEPAPAAVAPAPVAASQAKK